METFFIRRFVLFFACGASVACLAANHPIPTPIVCTDSNQVAVEVTIYNCNLGLVRDVRVVKLSEGIGELRFADVASAIMPATVCVASISHPADFKVLEQNYEYDLISEQKLLDKYVGKKINIVDVTEYKDKRQELEAILLSNNNGGTIFKIGDRIYLGYPGRVVLPSLPYDLIARPTLIWLFSCTRPVEQRLEISYLTADIGWTADYILALNADDKQCDLTGWVSIDNRSGATYRNAKLTLVAGNIRLSQQPPRRQALLQMAEDAIATSRQFEEQEFFEYHIYNLQRLATVKNNQTKQIQLLQAADIGAEKELLTISPEPAYGQPNTYGGAQKQPVEVFVRLKNSKKNRLGIPLPAGTIRVYKKDVSGNQHFVGEDRIAHTPQDEELKLKIGEAFDVVAERLQTGYTKISSRAYEAAWEISLRNRKKKTVTIGVVEKLSGQWKIVSKTHPYSVIDAFTIRFDVAVGAETEVKVTYKVKTEM